MEKLLSSLKENPLASQALIIEGEKILQSLNKGDNLYIKDAFIWKKKVISFFSK